VTITTPVFCIDNDSSHSGMGAGRSGRTVGVGDQD
jgi:hypothetical protein